MSATKKSNVRIEDYKKIYEWALTATGKEKKPVTMADIIRRLVHGNESKNGNNPPDKIGGE
jgi:hypothetical protein